MRKPGSRRGVIGPLLIFVLSLSCQWPFDTREPEPPKVQRSTWIQPTSPEMVLTNMKNAIAEKNIENYMRCLVDSVHSTKTFVYVPDPVVANTNPTLFRQWDIARERNYINQVFAVLPADSSRRLVFQELPSTVTPDSAVLKRNYELVLKHILPPKDFPREARGQAEFWLAKNDAGDWAIYRWIDAGIADAPSWSALRASFGK